MNPGDIIDLTLRNLRVVEVRPMSTLYMGVLPNGEPFEVRVPFDAATSTATATCAEWCDDTFADDHDNHICDQYAGHSGSHHCPGCGCWWRPRVPVTCACTLDATAAHTHRCALYVDAGPHTDTNHLCECGKQWGGAGE